MTSTSQHRGLPLLTTVAFLAACAGGQEPLAPSLDVTAALAGQGQLVICKAGNAAGSFNFNWSIDEVGVGTIATGSSTVAVGQCVVVATVPDVPPFTARFLATVTEQAPPANWAFTSAAVAYSRTVPATWPVGAVDATTRTVSNIGLYGDVGAEVTITNTYTPPAVGCTYTQGYWKTHSEFGPAPYDNTWAQLTSGASTTFYLSGKSWIEVFGTSPSGNAYYNLAHQFMAARLSILDGADPTAVASAIATATTLFTTYTPAQIGALKGNNALRQQFIALAGTLGSYNEGITGPGHCGSTGSGPI